MNTTVKEHYIIVKHAKDWNYYFDSDPRDGAHLSHSAFFTHTGKEAGVKLIYDNLVEAVEDCQRINELNPVGSYDVCALLPDRPDIDP